MVEQSGKQHRLIHHLSLPSRLRGQLNPKGFDRARGLFKEEREEAEDAEVNIKMKSKPDTIGIC